MHVIQACYVLMLHNVTYMLVMMLHNSNNLIYKKPYGCNVRGTGGGGGGPWWTGLTVCRP